MAVASASAALDSAIRPRESDLRWEPYSEARVQALRAQGVPVFVDFTAAWCITCQVNERLVLSRPAIQTLFKEHGVVTLVADWTLRDDHITEFLRRFDRQGVPLYVYVPANGEPIVLPQLLTEALVREAVVGNASEAMPE